MRKSFLFLLAGLLTFQIAIGQSGLKAKIEFEEAEKAFNENKFEDAVNKLDKAQEYLGIWSAKISYLKIVSLDTLCNYDDPTDKYTMLQQTEVKQYMNYANNNEKDIDVDKFKNVYAIEEKLKKLEVIESYIKKYAVFKKNKKAFEEMPEYAEGLNAQNKGDFPKAMEGFAKAIKKENPLALSRMGMHYKVGLGVEENYTTAENYYKASIDKGNLDDVYNIAWMYDKGGYGITKNETEEFKWYKLGAEIGVPSCFFYLGSYYEYGEGSIQNYQKALYWYKKDAENESTLAMRKVGDFYGFGKGIEKSKTEAFNWYLKAASWETVYTNGQKGYGNAEAMIRVGTFYEHGIVVEKNNSEAFKWYKKAVDNGYTDDYSMYWVLGEWYYKGVGTEKNLTEAFNWYKKAAENGVVAAMLSLSNMYKEGQGITKDKALAKEWQAKYETAKTKK